LWVLLQRLPVEPTEPTQDVQATAKQTQGQ
jgi:hypothetical protein